MSQASPTPLKGCVAQVRLTAKQYAAVKALMRSSGGVETLSSVLRRLVQKGLEATR